MDLPKHITQVVVIGGGPGGYAAAFTAADLGLEVTLVDLDPNPGGTCLYRGCIPSKALLHAAHVLHQAEEAEHWGITFKKPNIDVDRLREATGEVIAKMTGGLGQLAKARKITYLQGRAGFIDSHDLRVHFENGDSQEVAFENVIIATGSRPTTVRSLMLESKRVMNSTDALELSKVPRNLLVIGGGYIGLELTTVYAALGSEVTVVEMLPSLLTGADADLVKPLAERINTICKDVYLETSVVKMKKSRSGIVVTFDGAGLADEEKVQTFDRVLVSIGRTPNSSGLGLSSTKVEINDQGFIAVDDQMRTAEPHIFAIGDVVGQPMLAHKASHEGRVAAEVIAGHNVAFNPRAIPAVVFTDPELAWAGITENEAKAQGRNVTIGRFPWAASGRATTLNRSDGLTKVIADAETEELLGVGIVGPGAGEMIAEGAHAIEMGANAHDLALTIHPHPTLSETVMESAEMIFGTSTHIYRPKKK